MKRFRINRKKESIRLGLRENHLGPEHFLAPIFIIEGKNKIEEIDSMPNYFRYSLDKVSIQIDELISVGVNKFMLFVKVPKEKKDNKGKEALNPNGLMQESLKFLKQKYPNAVLFSDIALDPYSEYGHDGIVRNKRIINDDTIEVLAEMALSHAIAGADYVCPSDMMDGRVGRIRKKLEDNSFHEIGIMSYSAKYASSYYGPFRNALDSAPGFSDKKTYQMDFYNTREAIDESLEDEKEGADILMVKPGIAYLDILSKLRESTNLPLAMYQVSGEYSMIKLAAKNGLFSEKEIVIENLVAMKRAGANLIATYFAKEAAKYLRE